LEAAITPVLRAHGVGSVELTFQMEPGGWVFRVTVESLENEAGVSEGETRGPVVDTAKGIHLGLLTEIARDLSSVLDVTDVIPHHYNLEVSSPGLDRPLRSLRDFERAQGQLAKVHLSRPSADGQRVLRGHITSAKDGCIEMQVDGKTATVRFEDVERAHLIFELSANPKGGRAKLGKHQKH